MSCFILPSVPGRAGFGSSCFSRGKIELIKGWKPGKMKDLNYKKLHKTFSFINMLKLNFPYISFSVRYVNDQC